MIGSVASNTLKMHRLNDEIIKDYVTLLSEKYPSKAIAYADSFIPVLLSSRIRTNNSICIFLCF